MGRNNADFSQGKDPQIGDVLDALSAGKVTHEETASLTSMGDKAAEKRIYDITTSKRTEPDVHKKIHKDEMSGKAAKKAHKKAGLRTDW